MYKVFLCLIYLFFTILGCANPTDSNNLHNLSLANLLNYNPSISLAAGLKVTWEWLRDKI